MPSIWLIGVTVVLVLALVVLAWARAKSLEHERYIVRERSRSSANFRYRRPWAAQLIMQIVVSLALLGVGLYVILSKQYASADTNWAYGIVGTIIGFWLKGAAAK